jgi:hypothetical protein
MLPEPTQSELILSLLSCDFDTHVSPHISLVASHVPVPLQVFRSWVGRKT